VRAALWLLLAACAPATEGKLLSFSAEAVGEPLAASFSSPRGYQVTLARARLRLGALYLNQTNPAGWSEETACILPGIYTGEVRGGIEVDALSADPQPFAALGTGTDFPTRAAELWLTDGDVNAEEDRRPVLEVEGTATRSGGQWPFEATFTIGRNRAGPPRNPALPGSNPICKQRIISPVPADFVLANRGTVRLKVDPRRWFDTVEFSELRQVQDAPLLYRFVDSTVEGGQPDAALFNALRAASASTYQLSWTPGGP
jgi:hypothetical protein